jgi:hypothetical protein
MIGFILTPYVKYKLKQLCMLSYLNYKANFINTKVLF